VRKGLADRDLAALRGEADGLMGASELHLWFGGVGLPLALNRPFLIE
jgi:hypothetical protein